MNERWNRPVVRIIVGTFWKKSMYKSLESKFANKFKRGVCDLKKSCIFAADLMPHSSSGLGHQILSLNIESSNLSCGTQKSQPQFCGLAFFISAIVFIFQ